MSGEFSGDFTRHSFDPQKHFLRVLMQQGRVQVDADWNEQVAILLHYLQTLAEDLIGSHGTPVGRSGFKITFHTEDDVKNDTIINFQIGTGHYYVNGILCQNHKIDENGDELPIKYCKQPHYPLHPDQEKLPDLPFLVFLDVWERHITYIQDEEIREVALGGADTATRSQVIWQVKVEKLDKDATKCTDVDWKKLLEKWQSKNRGLLAAKAKETTEQNETCSIKPDTRYRDKENQLYRVEIHANSTGTQTFKWSRENGSVIFPIDADSGVEITGTTITLQLKHWWHDYRFGLTEGDWVEIVNDYISLNQLAKPLWKVDKIEPEDFLVTLTREESSECALTQYIGKHPFLRRWEQKEKSGLKLINGAIPISEATTDWFTLEDGVQIKFKQSESEENYRTGDYWLIPARIATGDVEWRKSANGKPLALPPHGVEHHYAPLAVIASKDGAEDCRRQFYPLASSHYYIGSTTGIGSDLIWTDANLQ